VVCCVWCVVCRVVCGVLCIVYCMVCGVPRFSVTWPVSGQEGGKLTLTCCPGR